MMARLELEACNDIRAQLEDSLEENVHLSRSLAEAHREANAASRLEGYVQANERYKEAPSDASRWSCKRSADPQAGILSRGPGDVSGLSPRSPPSGMVRVDLEQMQFNALVSSPRPTMSNACGSLGA